MHSGEVPPGVGVVGQPLAAADVLLQHENVVLPDRDHPWGGGRAREKEPVGRQPQAPNLVPEDAQRCAAAAKRCPGAPFRVLDYSSNRAVSDLLLEHRAHCLEAFLRHGRRMVDPHYPFLRLRRRRGAEDEALRGGGGAVVLGLGWVNEKRTKQGYRGGDAQHEDSS